MARTMIGAEELTVQPGRAGAFGPPRLEIDRLAALDDGGQPAVWDLSLTVRAGEIVGVAGNGQRQLVEVLAGQRDAAAGDIRIGGERYHARREEMRFHRLSCLPEEPLKNACVARMSIARIRSAALRPWRLVARSSAIPRAGGACDCALQDQDPRL
jgi:simple sugar transport system ATP-binding protein